MEQQMKHELTALAATLAEKLSCGAKENTSANV
jgi:hypothetical protein